MTLLNWAKSRTALFLAGSNTTYPICFMIGSGSGTTSLTDTTLVHPWDRQNVTTIYGDTSNKIRWTGDWTSVEVSGLSLTEFGLCISGDSTTGSMWSKTGIPSITFDGANELRIEENWEVY